MSVQCSNNMEIGMIKKLGQTLTDEFQTLKISSFPLSKFERGFSKTKVRGVYDRRP